MVTINLFKRFLSFNLVVLAILNLHALDEHGAVARAASTGDLVELVASQRAVEIKVEKLEKLLLKMQSTATAQGQLQTSVEDLADKVELMAINQAVILKCMSELLLRTGSTQPELQADVRTRLGITRVAFSSGARVAKSRVVGADGGACVARKDVDSR